MSGEHKARRIVRVSLVLLGLCAIQELVFSQVRFWGICPQFLPLAALIVGMREGPEFGGWFGLAAGVLSALIAPGFTVLWVIVSTLLGMGAGLAAQGGLRQDFVGSFLCTVGGMALLELGQAGVRLASGEGTAVSLARVAGPELFWSVIWFPLIYGLFALALHRKKELS